MNAVQRDQMTRTAIAVYEGRLRPPPQERRRMDMQEWIDLDRYPIHATGSAAYRALVDAAQTGLRNTGACELPGFLTAAGVARASAEAQAIEACAFASRSRATVYLGGADASLGATHARNQVVSSSVRVIAYDAVPTAHLLRRLYEWDVLLNFLADVLALAQLYRYADPLGALNIAVMGDGDALGWHFDQTDFVTSLALIPAEEGGDFHFHPLIRDATNENYEGVGAVLRGEQQDHVRLAMNPGTFLLFKGRHSLHRVTPIRGKTARIVALLAYDAKPGTDSTNELKLARYGRTSAQPHVAKHAN